MQNNTMAVASLVTGILSILTLSCCGPLSFFFCIAAVVTGFMGLKQASLGAGGKGMAIAGIACAGFGFLLWIAAMIFLFAFGGLSMITAGL